MKYGIGAGAEVEVKRETVIADEIEAKVLSVAKVKVDITIRKNRNEIVHLCNENVQRNRKVPVQAVHEEKNDDDLEAKIAPLIQIKKLKHQISFNKLKCDSKQPKTIRFLNIFQ